jgi:hypothetical protein
MIALNVGCSGAMNWIQTFVMLIGALPSRSFMRTLETSLIANERAAG